MIRATSREDAIQKTKEFLEVAGDGESELLEVLEMPPPSRGNADPFLIDSWFVFHETNFSTFETPENSLIEVALTPEQIAERMKGWTAPPLKYKTGVFQKYVKLVGSAAQGAVTG